MDQQILSTILWIGIGILIIFLLSDSATPSCPHCGNQGCGQTCDVARASFRGAFLGASLAANTSDTTTNSSQEVKDALVNNVVNPPQYLHINHKTKFSL